MMTIMGQVAERENIPLELLSAEVTKVMSANPRKISEVIINFDMSKLELSDRQQKMLENDARTCPVALSLAQDVKQNISFNY